MLSPALLRACGLSCGYSGKVVLSDVEIEVASGQTLALLGPNGSGKSTLLRTLCGVLPAISGEVELLGRSLRKLSAREAAKMVAVVPSEEAVEFPFTVREIVTMGRFPHSEGLFDTEEDARIAERAMEQAECIELADRPINKVSAGERQRALLARALAQQAPIMLLDEPTAHLDAAHQVAFARLIGGLAEQGLAVIAAVHDLNLAAQVADSGLVVSGGKVVCQGPLATILESKELDAAFGVGFERSGGADGKARLHPRF